VPNSKFKLFRCRPAQGVVHMGGMARRLRLQYRGAIYDLLARDNGRQKIVREDLDRGRFQEDRGNAAIRRSSRGSD
jgi:hypothetical protein